jgi:ubiquinone/menaquinone biosynthesis C-methylase UbiE
MNRRADRLRGIWDRQAGTYDRQMERFDRVLFRDSRHWVCAQAGGDVLEVAIGTGLNLGHYPPGIRLTGIEWSRAMLALARRRAAALGVAVELREGDAHQLPFAADTFDTVVCTFSLCAIADDRQALAEMVRVLRPGGLLLLADHVASACWPVRMAQRLLDLVSVPWAGEHWCRRPVHQVRAMGLPLESRDRFALGVVERLAARKSASVSVDDCPIRHEATPER